LDSGIENDDDAFHKNWIWLGMSTSVLMYLQDNELAPCSIHSTDELCDECKQTNVDYRFILKKVTCTQVLQ
jgi:hypothetical protein